MVITWSFDKAIESAILKIYSISRARRWAATSFNTDEISRWRGAGAAPNERPKTCLEKDKFSGSQSNTRWKRTYSIKKVALPHELERATRVSPQNNQWWHSRSQCCRVWERKSELIIQVTSAAGNKQSTEKNTWSCTATCAIARGVTDLRPISNATSDHVAVIFFNLLRLDGGSRLMTSSRLSSDIDDGEVKIYLNAWRG